MGAEAALQKLNIDIIDAENRGDREWLDGVLAPTFVLQRADGTIVDRETFLKQVAAGGTRVNGGIEPIDTYGRRAVVRSIVRIGERKIHNLRLFIFQENKWKLLAWANEDL